MDGQLFTPNKGVVYWQSGLPLWLSGEEFPAMPEMQVQSLGWGRCPGEGNVNTLQYSCLENPMDRGAWRATVCKVAKSRT